MVMVKNLHCADTEIPGGALRAWKVYKKKVGVDVPCVRCRNRTARHGGHVIKASPHADKKCYIVPLCVHCNELKDDIPFSVPEVAMVWAELLK